MEPTIRGEGVLTTAQRDALRAHLSNRDTPDDRRVLMAWQGTLPYSKRARWEAYAAAYAEIGESSDSIRNIIGRRP